MNDNILIRRANLTLDDAEALLAAERASLGDSPYDAAQALAVMRRPEHAEYLAYPASAPRQVVGFCSCLETPTPQGPRLEVDMLGVISAYRGQGLATRLIAYAVDKARARGVRSFRALVAVDNRASRRAFERVGFTASATAFDLLIYRLDGLAPVAFLPAGWRWEIEADSDSPAETHRLFDAPGSLAAVAECLRVQTLAYSGLWLERLDAAVPDIERLMARALVERAKSLSLDEVGYVAPAGDEDASDDLPNAAFIREGYQVAGRYLTLTAEG